jgi:hypothetical protein
MGNAKHGGKKYYKQSQFKILLLFLRHEIAEKIFWLVTLIN